MKTIVKLTDKEQEIFDFKKLGAFENMVDDRCDAFGVKNTIAYLMDNNLTQRELLAMGFDQSDIDDVIADDYEAGE